MHATHTGRQLHKMILPYIKYTQRRQMSKMHWKLQQFVVADILAKHTLTSNKMIFNLDSTLKYHIYKLVKLNLSSAKKT